MSPYRDVRFRNLGYSFCGQAEAGQRVIMSVSYMSELSEADGLGAQVIRVIAQTQRLPLDSISADSTFEELKIDSLDGINIIFALENEFGVEIPDEGVLNMRSISEVVEGVRKLLTAKQQLVPPGAA
jgi:acyl carrier protein